ncbi:MAG TPA: hypothetical protein DEP84_31365 [Chloroflexi bacterium]|nr:hypothetical protein [Chloroflexota bacterium]
MRLYEWMFRTRLSERLMFSFWAVVIAMLLLVGVPDLFLVRQELHHQSRARLDQGARASRALYRDRQEALADLAALLASRPAVNEALERGDFVPLGDYLSEFYAAANLDLFVLVAPDGEIIARSSAPTTWGNTMPPGLRPLPARRATYVANLPGGPAWLIAAVPVFTRDGTVAGQMLVGMLLDQRWVERLAEETGLDHSLILDGQRLATTASDTLALPIPADVWGRVSRGQAVETTIERGTTLMISRLVPLPGPNNEVHAAYEVLLPTSAVRAAIVRVFVLLISNALLAALVTAGFARWLGHRVAAPMERLSTAAVAMGHGDLTTPVPTELGPIEVGRLANSLEEMRARLAAATDQLRAEKARSESLIASLHEGVVTVDEERRVTSFSPGAELILGLPRQQAIGHLWREVLDLPEGSTRRWGEPDDSKRHKVSIVTPGGREVTLAITTAWLRIPDESAPREQVHVLRDITEEEEISRLKAYFLANISHEFQTPLAALAASIELLRLQFKTLSPQDRNELMLSIQRGTRRLENLVDNLLEGASIQAGHFRVHPAPMAFSEAVDEALLFMEPLLQMRSQRLELKIPTSLPDLHGDARRLTQVLVNLLSNASKYSPLGSTITVGAAVEGDALRVTVSDEGGGIPNEAREALFTRFTQVATNDPRRRGVGLGLWIVRTIVEAHGGHVGVQSAPAGGTSFWLTLPLTSASTGNADGESAESQPGRAMEQVAADDPF